MPRIPLRYGHKIILHTPTQDGFLTSTNSAMAPLGVRPESKDTLMPFEQAVFMLLPGEGEYNPRQEIPIGDEVKFGHVVRLIHNTQRSPVVHHANEHAILDKGAQRVTIDKPSRNNANSTTNTLYRTERFRILPRYKVRGEGERVCEGDHIIFQSSLASSSFINVSSHRDDRTDDCFEVQCGNAEHGFELRFYDADSASAATIIHGGQCVVLVHREVNRLVAAKVLNGDGPTTTREVLLDAPQVLTAVDPLSTKGTTHENLFIVEFEDRRRSGVVQVVERERYRLKSLAASAYLAVDPKRQSLYITSDLDVPGTLFVFHAASDDRAEALQSGGRVFLEVRFDTGSQWVSLDPRKVENENGEVLPYLRLQTKSTFSVSDGIEVQLLPFLEYRDLSIVLSLLPPLSSFITAIEKGMIESGMIMQVTANVQQLKRVCFRDTDDGGLIDALNGVDGVIEHTGQSRLLHQGVPQLLLKIVQKILSCEYLDKSLLTSAEDVTTLISKDALMLSSHVSSDPVRYTDIMDLVNHCLSVIQFVVRDNYRAALELRHLLPTLIAACNDIPAAVGCVAEFLRGNSSLLEELSDGGSSDLLRFMELLEERERDPVLMELVGLFAANRDDGFPDAQRIVSQRLVEDESLRKRLFLSFYRLDNGNVAIEVPEAYVAPKQALTLTTTAKSPSGEAMYLVALSDLASVASRARLVGRPSIIPLIAGQLQLLSAMCAGRKGFSIHALHTIITVDALADTLDATNIPPIVHAGLITLFASGVVIDCNCLSLEEVLSSMRLVVDDPQAEDPFVFEEEITDPVLLRARAYALGYLIEGNGSMSSDDGKREELDAVVRLTKSLLSRRCWPLSDFPTILHYLVAYLDKRNDAAVNDPEVYRDKITLIRTMDGFVDVILAVAAAKIARGFVANPDNPPFPPLCQFVDLHPESTLSVDFYNRRRSNQVPPRNKNASVAPEQPYRTLHYTLEVLLDIAMVPNWELRKEAIRFFCRLTNQWETLHYCVQCVYVTTCSSSEMFNTAKAAMEALTKYHITRKMAFKATDALKTLIYHLETGVMTTPRKPNTGGGSRPNILAIYKHHKAVSTTVAIMSDLEVIQSRTSDSGLGDLCLTGLRFLKLMAEADHSARDQLSTQINSLLFAAVAAPDQFMDLCRSVLVNELGVFKLSAATASELVSLMLRRGDLGMKAIELLRDILAVKDRGGRYLSRNQQLVWRRILACSGMSSMIKVHDTWTGRRGIAERAKRLASSDPSAQEDVRYHLAFMDLIFLTAKQNDLVKPEEIRYELFGANGVDDLMEVVSNLDVPATFRSTYINLLQVLVVEDAAGIGAMFNHRLLQEFLATCAFDIHSASIFVEGQNAVLPMDGVQSPSGTPTSTHSHSVSPPLASSMDPNPTSSSSISMRTPSFAIFTDRAAGYAFIGELISLSILPCVRHLMTRFSETASRMHPKIRATLSQALNDVVEVTVEFVYYLNDNADATIGASIFGDDRLTRKKLMQFLSDAMERDFTGNSTRSDRVARAVTIMKHVLDAFMQEQAAAKASVEVSPRRGSVAYRSVADISDRWETFVEDTFMALRTQPNQNAGGAGVILREMNLGTEFFKTLVSSLPYLNELVVRRVLSLIHQVLNMNEGDPEDCSVMLPFQPTSSIARKELSFSKDKSQRQDLAATFDINNPSKQVLPLVSDLISSPNPSVCSAAIQCAISLLDGGNRMMQEVMYASVLERGDEDIFVFLRDQLSSTRETMLTYIKILNRGSDPRDTLAGLDQMEELLRFTQLLCEGHFREIQEYLRVQPLNIVSVNVVEAMCDMLDVVTKAIDFRTIRFATQLLSTLVETLQGPCRTNQDFCVTAGVAERLVVLLTLTVEKDDHDDVDGEGLSSVPPEVLHQMRLRAMDCMLALTEGRTEKSFLSSLISSISLNSLCTAMEASVAAYEAVHGPLMSESDLFSLSGFCRKARSYIFPTRSDVGELDDELALAINVFIFLRSCLEHQNLLSQTGVEFEFTDAEGRTIKRVLRNTECFNAVNRKVGMVEILREGNIERSYFRILDSSSANLLKKNKDHLIKHVERSSDNRRLQSFLELSEALISEMEFNDQLRKTPLVSLFQDFDYVLDYFGLIWSIIINIVMLSIVDSERNAFEDPLSEDQQSILTSLSAVQIVLQGLLMLNYFVGPARIHYKSKIREWLSVKLQDAVDESRLNLSVDEPDVEDLTIESLPLLHQAGHAVYHTLMHGPFQQRVIYLAAAILGLTQSKIWYTIQLLHITSKSALLSNVLLAVTTNGVSLVLTLILMVVVIYIFSTVSFFHFSEFFDPDHLGRGYDCQSLASCWYLHIDSIRGGGVGDVTSAPYFDDANPVGFYYAAFRLFFFVVVVVIFLNIVFGIIVDSFAQLREERDEVENDQESKCFVCGIDQNEFDHLTPGGFEQHITSEHNMWHYVFFLHYLKVKDVAELNGQEADVLEKVLAKDTSFFPIGRSMATQAAEGEAGDTDKQLGRLSKTVDDIVARCASLEDRLHTVTDVILQEMQQIKAAIMKPSA